jgi:CheY-like chemotaxis protein
LTREIVPLRILVIEDNQDHARILKWSFEQSGRRNRIQFFSDPEPALKQLFQDSPDTSTVPDLIFLDLNLPRIDGKEVLKTLRSDDRTRSIPVIVLSSSDREEDIRRAYQLGANTYISKSQLLDRLSESLGVIQEYWSSIAKLPSRK